MVGIVEQQGEAAPGLAQVADAGDEVRRCPFMHDHHVGVVQRRCVVEPGSVSGDRQVGKPDSEALERSGAMVRDQVRAAPSVFRLQHPCQMTAPFQIRQDTPEKVRIAVVPVGDHGMGVEDELHAATAGVMRVEYNAWSCADCRDRVN
jgi:hypothetical protein